MFDQKGFWQAKYNLLTFQLTWRLRSGPLRVLFFWPPSIHQPYCWGLLWSTLTHLNEIQRERLLTTFSCPWPPTSPVPLHPLPNIISIAHHSGLSDWSRDEHMTQSEPLRYNETFVGVAAVCASTIAPWHLPFPWTLAELPTASPRDSAWALSQAAGAHCAHACSRPKYQSQFYQGAARAGIRVRRVACLMCKM